MIRASSLSWLVVLGLGVALYIWGDLIPWCISLQIPVVFESCFCRICGLAVYRMSCSGSCLSEVTSNLRAIFPLTLVCPFCVRCSLFPSRAFLAGTHFSEKARYENFLSLLAPLTVTARL